MPRRLKPKEVGKVQVERYGITVPLLLDRESLKFYVEFQGRSVSSDKAEEATRLGHEMIMKTVELEWRPVIEVSLGSGRDGQQECDLEFSFERFLVADATWLTKQERESTSGPKTMRRDWPPGRSAHSMTKEWYERGVDIKVDYRGTRYNRATRLPYTDETWAGLLRLTKVVRDARSRLKRLLNRKDAAALLAGMPLDRPLLPAPSDDELTDEEE